MLMAPLIPHISEELWEIMGHKPSIFHHSWPSYDKNAIQEETVEIVIQVNSKVRSHLSVPVDIGEDELKKRVLSDERVNTFLDGKKVVNIIIIPKNW